MGTKGESAAGALLASPTHAVVGATDLDRLAAEFETFGFVRSAEGALPAEAASALYGLDHPLNELVLTVPGAESGRIRLVETSEASPTGGPYDTRPIAIDLYTRDFDASVELARGIGAHLLEPVEYALGDLQVREIESVWSDGVTVVFLEVNARRPSVLDRDETRLHSEVHSIVWTVPSIEAELGLLRDAAGLDVLVDAEIRGPILSQLMGLPRPDVPARFTLLCDESATPARLELLEFLEDDGGPRETWPLRPGLHAAGFEVSDIDALASRLPGASVGRAIEFENAVHGRTRAASIATPGGVRLEVWQTDPA